jgi:hypothetical protein
MPIARRARHMDRPGARVGWGRFPDGDEVIYLYDVNDTPRQDMLDTCLQSGVAGADHPPSFSRPLRSAGNGRGQDAVRVEAALQAAHHLQVAIARRVQALHPVDGHPRRRVARG